MYQEFIPYEQAKELKELGFKEMCAAQYLGEDELELKWEQYRNMSINQSNLIQAPTYGQAFRWFRYKYNLLYFIGNTNISVYHTPVNNYHSTQMIQNCNSYEEAELATLKEFIDWVKSKNN